MLSVLRESVGGWVAKSFIGLLALLRCLGHRGMLQRLPRNALAVVGEQEITVDEFNFAFQRSIRTLSQRLGQNLTLAQAARSEYPPPGSRGADQRSGAR